MSEVRDAERFLKEYGDTYLELLKQVKGVCQNIRKQSGTGVVGDIYTRKDSMGGDNEFKEAAKIAAKARQRSEFVNFQAFLDLTDIIGLTVVVQYPDQVDEVIAQLQQQLALKHIGVSEPERHVNKNGYFATHLICTSQDVDQLHCEIQLKTMLHDAWSAKMHDLTYKPMGMLDSRLAALMASIAGTIESLEHQSRLIRDMIQAGWNVEESTRRIARENIFQALPKIQALAPNGEIAALVELQDRIERSAKVLETETIKHPDVIQLTNDVKSVCQANLRAGWMLAGRVASLRPTPEFTRFFMGYADAWLQTAPTLMLKSGFNEREISAVPLMYYVIGDLDRAIDSSAEILGAAAFANLSDRRKGRINFNRATFMIEREYHLPTTDQRARERLKRDIEGILAVPSVVAIKGETASEMLDTEGMRKITFAATKEEARLGIEDCVGARALGPVDASVSDAYADLHMRLGWRRYFELEIRERTRPAT